MRAIHKKQIKGFRIQDPEAMKTQMKDMINSQVLSLLQQWKAKASKDFGFRAEMEPKLQSLIRVLIEYCIEV